MIGLCSWLVFGFLVGLIARALMPGEQKMGFFKTSFLGIGGSFAGGFLASLLGGRGHDLSFHPTGFIFSTIGALVLLALGHWLFR